jgi:hypothetical protein
MAVTTTNGAGSVVDRAKSVQSFVWAVPAGPSTAVTITPTEPQQGLSISNESANYLRVRVTFAPGINAAVVAANRVHIVPPGKNHAIDLGAKHAGDSLGNHPISSIVVDVINPPTATTPTDAGTLGAGTAAAGVVVFNFASA